VFEMSLWLPSFTITMEQSSVTATRTSNPKRIIDIQTVKAAYTTLHINIYLEFTFHQPFSQNNAQIT
jgi:hypothetical protein